MDLKKSIGFGALLYIVLYVFGYVLTLLNFANASLIVAIIVTIITARILATFLDTEDFTELLKYSASWAIIAAVMDYLLMGGFGSVILYALIVVTPLSVKWCRCPLCKGGVKNMSQEMSEDETTEETSDEKMPPQMPGQF